MANKSPRETLDSSLKRLKAEVPASFALDPASPLHENLQRFVASGLARTPDTFDAELKSTSLIGLFTIPSSTVATADGKRWTQIAALTDPHRVIGIYDEREENPHIWLASVEENWDDRDSVPLPGGARPLCSFSELLPKIKRRKPAPVSTASPAVLEDITVEGAMPFRSADALLDGGVALLGAVRETRDAPFNELAQGLCVLDGARTVVLPLEATYSNQVAAARWSGGAIVVLGWRKMQLTHIGLVEPSEAGFKARELWSSNFSTTMRFEGHLAAVADLFAFATRVNADAQTFTVHVWRRSGEGWAPLAPVDVPFYIGDFAIDAGNRIVCAGYQGSVRVVHELSLAGDGLTVATHPSDRWPAGAFDVGDGLVASTMSNPRFIELFRDGRKVAAVKLGAKEYATATGFQGRLVACVQQESRQSSLHGWLIRGDAFVPWFEFTGASLDTGGGRFEPPTALKLADDSLFLHYSTSRKVVRRMRLPPTP